MGRMEWVGKCSELEVVISSLIRERDPNGVIIETVGE